MSVSHPRGCCLWIIPSVCLALLTGPAAARAGDAAVTAGHARFTVITPNLIRLQYAADERFTDASTLFAANRAARFDGAKIEHDGGRVTVTTPAVTLTFTDDGKPFSPDNLSADVRRPDGTTTRWTPGAADPLNLGGPIRTLDGVQGAVDLGHGLISRSGWAVVDDSRKPVLTADWVETRPNADETDLYLFAYGADYKAALRSLAVIGGPVPLPRRNLMGVWYSRFWPYTSDQFKQIVQQYQDHGFPLDNIVMDMDWHVTGKQPANGSIGGLIWTGYTWDKKLIPDPPALLKWFHELGLNVTLNDHPADGVQPIEASFGPFMRAMGADPAARKGLPFDAGSKKYLDTFYKFTHDPRMKDGCDFWWLDWQQYPFTRSIHTLSNLAWLNEYNMRYTARDGRRGTSFSRWAGWGDHRNPIHFSGDADSGWDMLAFEVPFTAASGNAGCFFWSHDIGGHNGARNEESYTRATQFGALSAALRSHSTRDPQMDRRPWTYPDWAEASMRVTFRLRAQLMPYVYTSAAESASQTVPLVRPMYIEHPDQEASYHNAQEYYFGDDLLVAPTVSPGVGPSRIASQVVWFPAGTGPWYDYFTGERFDGGTEVAVARGIDSFPLFVRAGTPIPMRPFTNRPTATAIDTLSIRCYPAAEGDASVHERTLYEDDGQSQAYEHGASAHTVLSSARHGDRTTLTVAATNGHYDGQPATRAYHVELPCLEHPTGATVDGKPAAVTYDAANTMATVEVTARPINRPVEIIVMATVASPQRVRDLAVGARLGRLVDHPLQATKFGPMVVEALGETEDPALRSAVLAAAGVAVVARDDAPYHYHGTPVLRAYAPPDLLDTPDVQATARTGATTVRFTPDAATTVDVSPVVQDEADAVAVPGHDLSIELTPTIGGKACAFSVAVPVVGSSVDLARSASVKASSTDDGYSPAGVNDGVADGYPNDRQHEWSSKHELAGASITLSWRAPQVISHVALYDRPNPNDQVLAGRLVFSDGSSEPFGELPNDGRTPAVVRFASRTVKWVRVELTQVKASTENAGLAEVAVYQ